MFSPNSPPTDAPKTRSRMRRILPKETTQSHQLAREDSVTPSVGRQAREDNAPTRARKAAREEEDGPKEKDKKDESIVWTKNTKYAVSLLPALPDCLKNSGSVIGVADPRHRHALIINDTSAWVWNYTDIHSLPHTYLFMLPQDESPNHNRDMPFPLGTLVSPSANSEEPGLVVVMPMSGRIAYWEAIGSAAAEGLFAKRRGVEGKVHLAPGENVTTICSIEPAGFILSLSSGHLAHLALRDAAGRPGIQITLLRDSSFMSNIFGALRGGSHRRDLVAVRAGRVGRMGERETVVATARGGLSKWYVQRSGSYETKPEVDLRETMIRAVERAAPIAVHRNREQFCILDMAIATTFDNDGTDLREQDVDLFILVGYVGPDEDDSLYALLEVKLTQSGRGDIRTVHPINCYTTPIEASRHSRPRIHIPKPRNTAFIVFTRAVVILSNIKPNEGGGRRTITEDDMDVDRQLLQEEEEEEMKVIFEDVVDFRGDANIDIVGSGGEDILFETFQPEGSFGHSGEDISHKKIVNPGVVLIARGAGVLRVEAFDAEDKRQRGRAIPTEEMVKSKIEQAVFFGHIGQNPLNFAGRKEVQFPLEEIENAALQISKEILTTSSAYIAPMLPSMERHLQLRGQRLRGLAEHLSLTYGPLSEPTRWQLLQDAEKLEAARGIWINYDERNTREEGAGEILPTIVQCMLDPSDTDVSDAVRVWFQKFVPDVGCLMQCAKVALMEKTTCGRRERTALVVADAEANDIVISGLQAAFDFRINSAGLYGFDGLIDEKGILINAQGFPDPWASPPDLLHAIDGQHEHSIHLIKGLWGPDIDRGKDTVERIALQIEELAEVLCRLFTERIRWYEQQSSLDEEMKARARDVRERYEKQRGGWVKPLVGLGRADAAYAIAERYQDFRTLVELASAELIQVETTPIDNLDEDQRLLVSQKRTDAVKRLEGYLERFKAPFAIEFYEYQIENGKLQELLEEFQTFQGYLTKFLHSSDRYAKLAWIYDASLGEYDRAGETLVRVALSQEDGLWNKKVELSIAKLCKLAALPDNQVLGSLQYMQNWQDESFTLIEIQELVYDYLQSFVRGAIDKEAEVDIAMKEKGRLVEKRLETKKLFKQALERLFNLKILQPEILIELLTLMEADENFPQFYHALVALGKSGLPIERYNLAEQSIWRRCYIQNDWIKILDTKKKTDEDVKDEIQNTYLYMTISKGLQTGLFEGPHTMRILIPEQSLYSENFDELRVRFAQADDAELAALSMDLTSENKLLHQYISKAKLTAWIGAVQATAQDDLAAEHEEGDEDIEIS
ncbi:Non-repetitive/WGA-negative nucleoporin C-terminal-domain-containing protein [Tirmania nivea]|nr:Non-repetitive/WGA-negative nucleoporin C-terminal-domain-containing protein [Tirmania nivea]